MKISHEYPLDVFSELMNENELVEFLWIPEVSSSQDHANVVKNLKRRFYLPFTCLLDYVGENVVKRCKSFGYRGKKKVEKQQKKMELALRTGVVG